MSRLLQLEKLLRQGMDSPLLRFSMGNELLAAERPDEAAEQFEKAVEQDPDYSAAWKLLGKALAEAGDTAAAITAYQSGIECAQRKQDHQAMKEMTVFLKRLQR